MLSAPFLARLAWLLLVLGSAGPAWSAEPIEPMPIATGVPPLARLVGQIGGQWVRAKSVLPPGANANTFRAADRRLLPLADTALYVGAGMPFESAWIARLVSANPQLTVVNAADGLAMDKEQPGYPWTSPLLTKQMAWRVRDALSAVDPPRAAYYRARTATLSSDLDALDRLLRTRLARATKRRFLATDPVWGPFAKAYGLVQVVADLGVQKGPHAASSLASQARREGTEVIVVPPGFDPQIAADLAAQSTARVHTLDPMSEDTGAVLTRLAGLIRDAESP